MSETRDVREAVAREIANALYHAGRYHTDAEYAAEVTSRVLALLGGGEPVAWERTFMTPAGEIKELVYDPTEGSVYGTDSKLVSVVPLYAHAAPSEPTKCEACDRPARYCGETHTYTPPAPPPLHPGRGRGHTAPRSSRRGKDADDASGRHGRRER